MGEEETSLSQDLSPSITAVTSAQSRPDVHPAKLVDGLYILADLLIDAERVINGTYGHRGVWRDLPPEREAALDKIIRDFDFLVTSKAVRDYADAWQGELDAEGGNQ